jgi:hypothetical protein
MGVGLLVEEHRVEIREAWLGAVETELAGERALEFAVGPLLRELSLALRADARPPSSRTDPLARCAVLVRAAASPARVAREFKLLHRAIWDTLRRAGQIVVAEERRAADEWLDEGLATALERTERLRTRIDLLERGPEVVPPRARAAPPPERQRPPPLPWKRPAATLVLPEAPATMSK